MTIRKAVINDAKWILDIRNNKIIRNLSNNKNIILLENHIKWLKEKLSNNKNINLISMNEKNSINWYCRLDCIKEWKYLISIAILPESNSKWIWTQLIKESISFLKTWDNISAEILESNIKSISFFNKFWFNKVKNEVYELKI